MEKASPATETGSLGENIVKNFSVSLCLRGEIVF
jgi:hypothetical protein